MRFTRMVFATALVAPSLSAAQAAPVPVWPIAPGSRVRILSPILGDQQQTGSVVSTTSDTLVFLPARQSTSTAITTPNIVRLEVARGKHQRKLKGALLGLLIGAGTGAVIGYATYKKQEPCPFCIDFGPEFDAAVLGVVVGSAGALAGALVGSRETDTWVQVSVPRQLGVRQPSTGFR